MEIYYVPEFAVLERDEGLRIAGRWLVEHSGEGEPTVMVTVHDQATRSPVLEQIVRRFGYETPRNWPPRGWGGGPLLSVWPRDAQLERIFQYRSRITSLCIVKFTEEQADSLLRGSGATDISGLVDRDEVPAISDPVIEVAMESITRSINLNNHLVQSEDRSVAIRRLQYLYDNGYTLVPDELEAWALGHAWSPKGAARLRDYAERIDQGRTFRGLVFPRIRDGGKGIERWREQAGLE